MATQKWNWQQPDWPNFSHEKSRMETFEKAYLKASGVSLGMMQSLGSEEQAMYAVEFMADEAVQTSEIEGEILNRDSVRFSIIREFDLGDDSKLSGIKPEELGIARMMKQLYGAFKVPLTHEMLWDWHDQLMCGRHGIKAGEYRTHKEDMKIISGPLHKTRTHFIAPPSDQVPEEMDTFIAWFNRTAPGQSNPLPPLTRAGIAHLYFLSIHPFEDGNGRLSRALVIKALSQEMDAPVLTAISSVINVRRKAYYELLGVQSKGNEITDYLTDFGQTLLDAQQLTIERLDFITAKAKYLHYFQRGLNPRQEKAVLRIFREGLNGFQGGLSVKNYIAITKASRATATRDLSDLVQKGAFSRTGKLKSTRYELHLAPFHSRMFRMGD